MNNKLYGITIFTPTYNRAYTLERLYNSLKKQNDKNFEWLIIDDGSTDETKKIVSKWIKEKKIKIRYIYQKNQGKHVAHNTGVLNSKYELFMCVDSDDYISNTAVEEINKISKKYLHNNIIGIIAYKENIKKPSIIKKINVKFLTISELHRKYHFKDEALFIYKSEILEKYLFPVIAGEKFIPEAYLYDQLDNLGLMYLYQQKVYLYEYLSDGYSRNMVRVLRNNCKGYMLYSKQRLEISKLFANKIKGAIQYNNACLIASQKWEKTSLTNYVLLVILWPISLIFYLLKYRNKGD